MGIRGLTEALRSYGTADSLDGGHVVIDGPALVHKICSGCLVLGPRGETYLCQPTYAQLGQLTVAWLDNLRSHNITVRKIYFDGYLPPSKWDVRIQRLISQCGKLKRLSSRETQGVLVSPKSAFASVTADISLAKAKGHSPSDQLPQPAFLIPAVLSTLREHELWRTLVQIVPGEADDFCAEDIKQNGGTVLTSDSDLLIQDLGPNGSVSFFSDLTETRRDGQSKLQTITFHYEELNKKLGINELGGLLRIAFEMERRQASLDKAIQVVKKDPYSLDNSRKFLDFKSEHSMRQHISPGHPVVDVLFNLDPRLSELVIQTQLSQLTVPQSHSDQTSRGCHRLSMFLPVMTEDPSKKSSWTMSTKLREIAYSLLKTVASCKDESVIEYRFLIAGRQQAGRQVDLLDATQLQTECTELCKTFSMLDCLLELKDILWFAFIVYFELQWSSREEKASPIASFVGRAKRGVRDLLRYPWDLIHLTARVNATFYSLRMIQQALLVTKALSVERQNGHSDLRKWLERLPSIDEWPTVDTIQPMLARLGTTGISEISNILGLPETGVSGAFGENKKKRKTTSAEAASKRPASGTMSSNPFAMLGQGSDE